jgi:hypothetical protein
MLTNLVNTTWSEIPVSEGISVSYYALSEEWEVFENACQWNLCKTNPR